MNLKNSALGSPNTLFVKNERRRSREKVTKSSVFFKDDQCINFLRFCPFFLNFWGNDLFRACHGLKSQFFA